MLCRQAATQVNVDAAIQFKVRGFYAARCVYSIRFTIACILFFSKGFGNGQSDEFRFILLYSVFDRVSTVIQRVFRYATAAHRRRLVAELTQHYASPSKRATGGQVAPGCGRQQRRVLYRSSTRLNGQTSVTVNRLTKIATVCTPLTSSFAGSPICE